MHDGRELRREENELPRSKLRGIPRNEDHIEKPGFLKLFLAETPEQSSEECSDSSPTIDNIPQLIHPGTPFLHIRY